MYQAIFDKLLAYCRQEDWQGYDPYDGLNSRWTPLLPPSKYPRMCWIQFFKRCPWNLRRWLGVAKGENSKGLALLVRALLCAYRATGQAIYRRDAEELLERLWALRSPGYGEKMCWGYNFDWQSRAFFVPRQTPSVVCTTFVAQAWLDHYELFQEESSRQVALAACQFLLTDLRRTPLNNNNLPLSTTAANQRQPLSEADLQNAFCFSYTPIDDTQVHNINLLAAELLARTSRVAQDVALLPPALDAARFTVAHQQPNGAWPYGLAQNQQWCDNFHTGFNLVSLANIIADARWHAAQPALQIGLQYYLDHFFLADGTPKYYDKAVYPIDIHSAAQAIVTLVALRSLIPDAKVRIKQVLDWTLQHLYAETGYFYFQRTAYYTNRISYMRWSQAWMAYALALATFTETTVQP
jgi:hypothetical protein